MSAAHEHSWVNTATGVTCTTCPAKIDAPECAHTFRFDRIEDTGQSVRKAYLVCTECDFVQAKLTTRSDQEIAAELKTVGLEVPEVLAGG